MKRKGIGLTQAKQLLAHDPDYLRSRGVQNYLKKNPGKDVYDYLDTKTDTYLKRIAQPLSKGKTLAESRGHKTPEKDILKGKKSGEKELAGAKRYLFRFREGNYFTRQKQIDELVSSFDPRKRIMVVVLGNVYNDQKPMNQWDWRSSLPFSAGNLQAEMRKGTPALEWIRDYFSIMDYVRVSKAGKILATNRGIRAVEIVVWE